MTACTTISQSITYAVRIKMSPLMIKSGVAGLTLLYLEMMRATMPIPPLETPCRSRMPMPMPSNTEPKARSSHSLWNGVSHKNAERLTETDVTVIPRSVPIALAALKKYTANTSMEEFSIQSAMLRGTWNQWWKSTVSPPAPPDGMAFGNKNTPIE